MKKLKDWKCQTCHQGLRVGVSLFLDIPSRLQSRLSKKNLRDASVKITGAGWDHAYYYCPNLCTATHLSGEKEARKHLSAVYSFLRTKGLSDEALIYVKAVCVAAPNKGDK